MKITPGEEYGLRCLLQLAREHRGGRALTLPEIASREGMPIPNTAKLLRKLRLAGLVESARGRTGGYALARSPREISLAEALSALDGPMFERMDCATVSEHACVRTGDCSVRSLWAGVEDLVRSALAKVSLEDLVSDEAQTSRRLGSAWVADRNLASVRWGGRGDGALEPFELRED